MRRPAVLGLALLIGIWLAMPGAVAADAPMDGRILAPGDHVLPGGVVTIVGADLEAGAVVTLRLASGASSVVLGSAPVKDDGTMDATAVVPDDFPVGYATLTVTAGSGSQWSTYVLIGERAEGPRPVESAGFAIDPRIVAMLLIAVGLVVFLAAGARYLRR